MNKDSTPSPLRDQVAGIGRADYPPTQAQIEAAVIINRRLSDASLKALSLGTKATMERMADLEALTAAAEAQEKSRERMIREKGGALHTGGAGEQDDRDIKIDTLQKANDFLNEANTNLHLEIEKLQIKLAAALTAAAEVREQWKPDIHGTKSEIWDTAVAATIERCAQVGKAINGEIEGHIALCSMRPSPLSSEGRAWESGARQGWSWAIEHFAAAIRAMKDKP